MQTALPPDISHVIQVAIAPAFLLTAVASTLSVLAARLARVVDRGRSLKAGAAPSASGEGTAELARIEKRARAILWGMSLATVCGICTSLVIAVAFVGFVLGVSLGSYVALLFIVAMATYTGALLCLLHEVFLAARSFSLLGQTGR